MRETWKAPRKAEVGLPECLNQAVLTQGRATRVLPETRGNEAPHPRPVSSSAEPLPLQLWAPCLATRHTRCAPAARPALCWALGHSSCLPGVWWESQIVNRKSHTTLSYR